MRQKNPKYMKEIEEFVDSSDRQLDRSSGYRRASCNTDDEDHV